MGVFLSVFQTPFYGCFQTLNRNEFLWMITSFGAKKCLVLKFVLDKTEVMVFWVLHIYMFCNRWKSEKASNVKKFQCCSFAKKKAKFNLAASSDLAVTCRRTINYIVNKTFPIVIMLDFRTKLYMQHLRSLFCFLLTILSILSFTVFPLISAWSKISAARHFTIRSK